MTPLERMIDKACGVKPGDLSHLIILECPRCHKQLSASREPHTPAEAVKELFPCPKCIHQETEVRWVDKNGKEVK